MQATVINYPPILRTAFEKNSSEANEPYMPLTDGFSSAEGLIQVIKIL
jgi:hypothetical protein